MIKRTVIVTGGSRGIGRAICMAFAREGFHLVIHGRDTNALAAVAREAGAAGGSTVCVEGDIRQETTARNLARAAGDRADILINNAGVFRAAPFLETDIQTQWRDLLDINLTGTFLATFHCMPLLLKSDRAHLINILSVAALNGFPWNAGYAASKFGARGLTESLRAEFGDRIRVTAICPGATDTAAWDDAPFPHDRSKMLTTEDVAAAVVDAWRAEVAPGLVVLETPPGAVGGS